MDKQKTINFLLLGISFLCYCFFAFYVVRYQSIPLLFCFGLLFLTYLWTLRSERSSDIAFWVYASIAFRFCFLFSTPLLSDDFYRFIWDGRLLAAGIHPFAELPSYYIQNSLSIQGIDEALFSKLNSPDYYTIYPPINQFVFWVSVKLSFNSIIGSVVVMRLFIFSAEVGSIWLLKKILARLQLPSRNILFYALNPLVIVELTGNLHFEALMIFFLLLSYWLLTSDHLVSAAVSFGFAICCKLLPVIFLPLLIGRLGLKKAIVFGLTVLVTVLVLFTPLLTSEIVSGFNESIGYYFKKFEFNASIYYLVREWGFWNYGYNIIQTVGWKLAAYCTAAILSFSLWDVVRNSKLNVQKSMFESFTVVLTIYLAFSTTVHPWYVTTLVAFSVFIPYKFAIVWSALIFLTYVGYAETIFSENLYLVAVEYILVFAYLAYELLWKKKQSLDDSNFENSGQTIF